MSDKPVIAVHKFTSCDGCQLAFLNLGEPLLELADQVEIRHFLEAGFCDPLATVDIAFIEGSVSTPEDLERIKTIRTNSQYLVTMGACATSGGLQALRNYADAEEWISAIYAQPDAISALDHSTPISEHVKVDYEIWGCPVDSRSLLAAAKSLLLGVVPARDGGEKLCQECKRKQIPCVMVTSNRGCLGPVTKAGCGALCPALGRGCYGCYGPQENANVASLKERLREAGMSDSEISNSLKFIYSNEQSLQ